MSSTQQLLLGEGAGGGAGAPVYIEDVFSTWLYNGSASAQTLVTGIDLSTKGGMVWGKSRSSGAYNHEIVDTVRGVTSAIFPNRTNAADIQSPSDVTSFNTNGVTLRGDSVINLSGGTQVLWTFREQAKFFDVVTYTGTGSNTTIAHALGSVPGCIITKRIDSTSNWQVYHRGLSSAAYIIQFNLTNAEVSAPTLWDSTAPTSTVFSLGTSATANASGGTYVAYVFAHNAGGFGLTGTDNVISCGSFSFVAGKTTVNLGYEPQYLLMKRYDTAGEQWWLFDTMRGMTASLTGNNYLGPNTTAAEADLGSITQPTATGFYLDWSNNGVTTGNYIYIAIRRGPMKVPTSGTSVFSPNLWTQTGGI